MSAGSNDGAVSVMCLRRYSDEFLDKYGFVIPASEIEDRYLDLSGAVEKPGVERAPSNLGLVGRYLFTPEVFSILNKTDPGFGGEIQLTDAINELGQRGRLRGYVAETDLLDTGTPEGLLQATKILGTHQFGDEVFES
jgi:UTP--glucose-1-phosphate uridylyltransferase